ncbi:3-oxoacyl-ACP synthase III family protein [Ktedonosporobacter rubrisoli]|uniref:3-oxoacyl-ACP synthase III family protein n=1 Tax=Ktedonosporobacter rubrisoli TaxID=2509675 RepID=A0A4P6JPA1_KTERU|nr:3-oxoacyl-ACP synthase III family protein [Ktedonosporobacter rubrisoli]QBD77197.1 3-oxoacyl-ACP synthase III family protein [Ktedonosporobacter rubrisoli]
MRRDITADTWPAYRYIVPDTYTQAKVRLTGLGSSIPKGMITNDFFAYIATRLGYPRKGTDFERATGLSARCVRSCTLEQCRRIAGTDAPGLIDDPMAFHDESLIDMAVAAAQHALASAGREAPEVDMVIATSSSDNYIFPTIAGLVQRQLGCRSIRASTLKGGCACITEALQMAAEALATSNVRVVLIVAAEAVIANSVHILDWRSSLLFGEGASAFVLERGITQGDETYAINGYNAHQAEVLWYQALLHKDAREAVNIDQQILEMYQKSCGEQVDHLLAKYRMGYASMSGKRVYEDAPQAMAECVDVLCRHAHLSPEELGSIVPHQANSRIVRRVGEVLMLEYGWPGNTSGKLADYFCSYGNLSNASIGVALVEMLRSQRLQPGQWIALPAAGGGFHYGCWLFQYQGLKHSEVLVA